MWWFTAPRIAFGPEALDELPHLLDRGGGSHNDARRVAVVTDAVMAKRGFAAQVVKLCGAAGYEAQVFDEVEPEPSLDTVRRGAEFVRRFGPRWLVGLGGGSALDAAKAMWLLYEHPDIDIEQVTPLEPVPLGRKAQLIAVPTTSGTGAETTWAMVLTDAHANRKLEPATRDAVPTYALVDPRFAVEMPPALTAGTGLDALTHGLEAAVSQWRNDFTDGLAAHAARLAFQWLPVAVREPANATAREHMHNAACIAGLAFGNSQVGVAHSLGHAFGAAFRIHHGRSVGLALAPVIEFSLRESAAQARYAEIARTVWPFEAPRGDEPAARLLATKVRELRAGLGEPPTLKDCGVNEAQFREKLDEMVEHALGDPCTVTGPRSPGEAELRRLFGALFTGGRVSF